MSEQAQEVEMTDDELFAEAYAAAGGHVDKPTSPEPVEQPVPEQTEEVVAEAPEEAVEAVEEPQEAPADDLWANASPEQREAFTRLQQQNAQLEHNFQSNVGRVSALQRKLNEVEKSLTERQAQPAPQAQAEPEVKQEAEPEEAYDLSSFKDDFPDVYAAMQAMNNRERAELQKSFDQRLAQLDERFSQVSAPMEQLQEERQLEYKQRQLSALSAAHPDWQEVSQTDNFRSWLDQQTDGIRALIQSTAAQDNIVLLNLYKGTQAPTPAPEQAPRVERPQRPVSPGLPRTAAAGRVHQGIHPNDEESAWKYWSENYDKL